MDSKIDSTYLDIHNADNNYQYGRDYLAHAIRWTSILRKLEQYNKPVTIFDVCAGRMLPLARTIFSNRKWNILNRLYAFDVKFESESRRTYMNKVTTIEGDFCDTWSNVTAVPDIITCFEGFEHMEFSHAWRLVRAIRECCASHTRVYFSTPNYDYNKGAAKNHQNECNIKLIRALFGNCAFSIVKEKGMYADIKHCKGWCKKVGWETVYEYMSATYNNAVISTMFAAEIPELSKNVMYTLEPVEKSTCTDELIITLAADKTLRQQ